MKLIEITDFGHNDEVYFIVEYLEPQNSGGWQPMKSKRTQLKRYSSLKLRMSLIGKRSAHVRFFKLEGRITSFKVRKPKGVVL